MCSFTPHRIRYLSSDNHSDYWNINMEYKRCYRLLTFRLCWLFILQTLGRITRLNVHCAHKETLAEPQVTSRFDGAPERKLSWQQVTSQTSAQLQLFNCFPQAKKTRVDITQHVPPDTSVYIIHSNTIWASDHVDKSGSDRGQRAWTPQTSTQRERDPNSIWADYKCSACVLMQTCREVFRPASDEQSDGDSLMSETQEE